MTKLCPRTLARIVPVIALGIGLAASTSAQVPSVADQFNVVLPVAPNGEVAVITLRNPSQCGTVTYRTFVSSYSSSSTNICSDPRTDAFTGVLVKVCPTSGSTTIGSNVVHQVIVPAAVSAPTWISIQYTGVSTDTHLQADLALYDLSPTSPNARMLSQRALVRDGLIR